MPALSALSHRLDRTIVIRARPATVFTFFTDTPRWASWWGSGSTIDPKPGGRVLIRYPGGNEATGEVVEIAPPERIVFTYGYTSGKPIGPGESQVTIRLEALEAGTRVHLSHEFADAAVRTEHVQGWRYQLSVFGNVVADVVSTGAADLVDAWFKVWGEPNEAAREQTLAKLATRGVRVRDRYSVLDGIADLSPHIAASQRFMPGIRLERRGEVRHCQGTLLVDWVALGPDGAQRGTGSNVFDLNPDGLIDSVTGFWG
jgi:uncharacterized protein YndB with AHSA1/START domain